jgi:hypothetical protein
MSMMATDTCSIAASSKTIPLRVFISQLHLTGMMEGRSRKWSVGTCLSLKQRSCRKIICNSQESKLLYETHPGAPRSGFHVSLTKSGVVSRAGIELLRSVQKQNICLNQNMSHHGKHGQAGHDCYSVMLSIFISREVGSGEWPDWVWMVNSRWWFTVIYWLLHQKDLGLLGSQSMV